MVAVANGAGGPATFHWLATTHLGVPVASSNSAGTATTLTGVTLLGFPGQTQTFADLYYNQYRDYDPTTGRYIQADPIGLNGDPNPYVYAGANPVGMVDPWGLFRKGLGFTNEEWSAFDAAQQNAANRLDRGAADMDARATADPENAERYRNAASHMRTAASILRDTGPTARVANLYDREAYILVRSRFPGNGAGSGAYTHDMCSEFSRGPTGDLDWTTNPLWWVIGHEALHHAGLRDYSRDGARAYRRSSRAEDRRLYSEISGDDESYSNPDSLLDRVD